MSRRLFVAIPSHDGKVTIPTLLSLVHGQTEVAALGWTMHVECIGGDADIAHARNVLLGLFLASDCTDLVFVDADISWGEGALARLVLPEAPFVAGVYRLRTDDVVHYPVHWSNPKRMVVDPVTKQPLISAELVPGGFWRLSRHLVEEMSDNMEPVNDPTMPDVEYPFLFDWTWDGRRRRSEDYTFCARWRERGGEIWVDPAIALDHTGIKVFQGNLLAHLAKEAGEGMRELSVLERAKRLATA